MRGEDIERLEMFLARVNAVTVYHRHGQTIPPHRLNVLSDEQLYMESWLKDRRAELAEEKPNAPQHTQPKIICGAYNLDCEHRGKNGICNHGYGNCSEQITSGGA